MNIMEKSPFTVEHSIERNGIKTLALYQTMTGSFMLIGKDDWQKLLRTPAELADPALMEILLGQGFLVKPGTDEIAVYENWRQQHVQDGSIITVKVLVTRKCNNRCRYCLVLPEAKSMTRQTALATDRFLMALLDEKRSRKLSIEYSGGEVLLNPKVVIESATRLFYFCRGRGIDFELSIITNGTLLNRAVIERLLEVGLKGIRTSIAGGREVHDVLRPSKKRGRTYDIIMQNLRSISGLVPITVECQYDSGSTGYLTVHEMMNDFDKLGIEVKTINFAPIIQTRNGAPYESGIGDLGIYQNLRREAQKRGYPQFDVPPSNTCAADLRYHLVVDTDGSIVPCPALQGGELSYGSVFTGIDFIAESLILKRNLPDKCLKGRCELLPICGGGCRLEPLVKENSFQGIGCRYDMLRVLLSEYITQKAEMVLDSAGQDAKYR